MTPKKYQEAWKTDLSSERIFRLPCGNNPTCGAFAQGTSDSAQSFLKTLYEKGWRLISDHGNDPVPTCPDCCDRLRKIQLQAESQTINMTMPTGYAPDARPVTRAARGVADGGQLTDNPIYDDGDENYE